MEEKTKLIYMLLAIQSTLTTRLQAPQELVDVLSSTISQVSGHVDPEMTVPPPAILLLVNDFKLSKDVAERVNP